MWIPGSKTTGSNSILKLVASTLDSTYTYTLDLERANVLIGNPLEKNLLLALTLAGFLEKGVGAAVKFLNLRDKMFYAEEVAGIG
ncbi:jg11563 [Pararge aegeria aegeria]|uniref:Jg11563 protein n=1 Tax=Pararge aegeria aegeria TaxID=348720 RepID=A0A8S4SHH6_9NEOP|nr:jg11563 [Pararge aegeria aegeria]